MASRTIHICDCCGREVKEVYECYRELRTWNGYKQIPAIWELCPYCHSRLENALADRVKEVRKDSDLGLI